MSLTLTTRVHKWHKISFFCLHIFASFVIPIFSNKRGGGWKIYIEPRLNIVKVADLKTNKNQSNHIENPNLPKLPTVWPWRSPPGTAVFLSWCCWPADASGPFAKNKDTLKASLRTKIQNTKYDNFFSFYFSELSLITLFWEFKWTTYCLINIIKKMGKCCVPRTWMCSG